MQLLRQATLRRDCAALVATLDHRIFPFIIPMNDVRITRIDTPGQREAA